MASSNEEKVRMRQEIAGHTILAAISGWPTIWPKQARERSTWTGSVLTSSIFGERNANERYCPAGRILPK
jgi:hypothetical protein